MNAQMKSTPTMGQVLAKRQLVALLDAVIARAGDRSPTGFSGLVNKAEQALRANKISDAGEHVRQAEALINERDERDNQEQHARQAERLAKKRGEQTAKQEGGPSTRDGFLWLSMKGRLVPHRLDAGQRYGAMFARARADGVKSCLNDEVVGGDGDGPSASKVRAVAELTALRIHIYRAMSQDQGKRLVTLLDEVCGSGVALRQLAKGDDRKAHAMEAELMIALDMVATHLGILAAPRPLALSA